MKSINPKIVAEKKAKAEIKRARKRKKIQEWFVSETAKKFTIG